MLVPNGKVSPGLSFFRALEQLAKPQQAGQAAQAKATAKPAGAQQAQQKAAPDHVQASRQADPGHKAQQAADNGRAYPRGSFLDIRV